jgi:RNA-directed DNA polymerase
MEKNRNLKGGVGAGMKVEKPEHTCEARDGISEVTGYELQTSLAEKEKLFSNSQYLIEEMVHKSNMTKAFKRVLSNKGSAGVDGMSVEDMKSYCQDHWEKIRKDLLEGRYKPQPVLRAEIPKLDGGKRKLGIPCVIDRLIQQAATQILGPMFDKDFSESSYGYRPGRSAHDAVLKARVYMREGKRWVVDIDLSKFFDRVNHDMLMHKVSRKVKDKRMLRLIGSFLRVPIKEGNKLNPNLEGCPQGGPLSPILSNIMLDELDKELELRGHCFCRYVDDCNIYVKSLKAGERVMASVTGFLEKKLKLLVNRDKSKVDRPWNRKFLGYSFTSSKKGQLKPSPISVKGARKTLKEIFRKGRGRSVSKVIAEVNQFTRGWVQYYKWSDIKASFQVLDEWLRRRLRLIIWKHWKKPKTRFKRFRKYGFDKDRAKMSAYNYRGSWWNSGASHMNQVISIKWLESMGLINLQNLYRKLYFTGSAEYGTVSSVL